MTSTERRLAAIAVGQLGTFTRAQALDVGLSNRQLRSRVRSGILVQTGPNAFRVAGTPSMPRSRLSAMLLDVGAPVVAAGPTAAAVHGIDGFVVAEPFHLQVPADRNVRRQRAVIHRTERFGAIDRCVVDDLPCTSVARTIIDLARWCPPTQIRRAVEQLVADGRLSESHLFRRIGSLRSQGRYGIPMLLEVLEHRELVRGGESWLEREYLRLLARHGLPRPRTQVVTTRAADRIVRVDCSFPGTDVVVELMGYRFHRTRSQMNRDAERHNALIAIGKRVFQFTYDQVTRTPHAVVDATVRALAPGPG